MEHESNQIFVARQPILDRQRRLVAYELLFRGSPEATAAQVAEPSLATARVAVDAFLSMGIANVLGPHRGFLNVDLEMLASEAIEVLPADRIVLEVLETVPSWAVARCRELRERGFELALDDFQPDDERRALLDVADYVKVDLMQAERRSLPAFVRRVESLGAQPLAEKVETGDEFEDCSRMGFSLFQGYFFARPTTLSGRKLEPERHGLLSAFRAVSEDRPTAEIEDVFKRHARLGVQLLRIANSAALGSVQRIDTFAHAILYIGREPLRRWLLLLLYASDGADASANPTLEMAAIRGRLLELLSPMATGIQGSDAVANDRAFLAGMLSLGDAILSTKLGDILDQIEVEPEIRTAVLERSGPLGRLLQLVEAIEAGRFGEISELMEPLGLSHEELAHAQREAYAWYRPLGAQEMLGGGI